MPAMAAKVVNSTCPISGMKIDPLTVPDDRVLDFDGKKVGFCSTACVTEWGKLSDADKKAKLDKAMATK